MQNWEGNMNLTENRFHGNKIWCVEDYHNYMCHICAKEFFHLNFNQTVFY